MCGRFIILPEPGTWHEVADTLGDCVAALIADSKPRYNVAPTQQIIFIRNVEEGPVSEEARWGLVPHWWSKPKLPTFTINARAEEAHGKPMWRHAWRHNRCLIPTNGWYEWSEETWGKQPWHIRDPGGYGMLMAGLWAWWQKSEDEDPVLSCAILTCAASPSIKVHDRMPVVLPKQAWAQWLDPKLTDPEAVTQLWKEHCRQDFEVYAVNKAVNSSRSQGEDLIHRVEIKPRPF